jgi:hypothetical protein
VADDEGLVGGKDLRGTSKIRFSVFAANDNLIDADVNGVFNIDCNIYHSKMFSGM